MATRETQIKITTAALALFNEHGSASVSFEKIASKAGISKGNLHYHYSSKEEIVMALWAQLDTKLNHWSAVSSSSLPPHIPKIMIDQFRVIWDYRFIFSELNFLLAKDPDLRYRFVKHRDKRMEIILQFCKIMVQRNVLKATMTDGEIRRLIKTVWVISVYWLSYVFTGGEEITFDAMNEGYELVAQLIKPYLVDESILPVSLASMAITSAPTTLQITAGGTSG